MLKLPCSRKKVSERPEHNVPEGAGAQSEEPRERIATGDLTTTASTSGPVLALLRHAGSIIRAPWSIWKIAAVAVLIYIAGANVSYFLVLNPVRVRLENLKEKKDIIQDFFIVRESSTAVAGFRDALMHGDQRMTVIAVLEEMAEDAGLRLSAGSELLGGEDLSDRVTEYPIEISLVGSYHELGQFIAAIESSERYLAVRSVEIDGSENGAGNADVRVIVGAASWEG